MSYDARIYYENAVCISCDTKLAVQLVGDFVLRTCETCNYKRIELPRTPYDPPTEKEFVDKYAAMGVRLARMDP